MTITKSEGKHMKMGHVYGPGKGVEVPVKADQYFNRLGGHFVYLDSNGSAVDACATAGGAAAELYGWVETPKDASGKNSWKSNANTDDIFPDKVYCINGLEDRFRIPMSFSTFDSITATIAQSFVGAGCNTSSIDESNATYAHLQKVNYNSNTEASINLTIHEVDYASSTCIVSIRPTIMQRGIIA